MGRRQAVISRISARQEGSKSVNQRRRFPCRLHCGRSIVSQRICLSARIVPPPNIHSSRRSAKRTLIPGVGPFFCTETNTPTTPSCFLPKFAFFPQSAFFNNAAMTPAAFSAPAQLTVRASPRARTACARPSPRAAAAKPAAQQVSAPPAPKQKSDKRAPPPSTAPSTTLVLGLSHHTATVDVRERLAVPEPEWQSAAADLCGLPSISEAAVLSTCNRFEVYLVTRDPFAAIHEVVSHLGKGAGIPAGVLRRHLFMLVGDEAVWHLLRVSAGLDSLVVGEGQILSQVKKCYELASEKKGCAGKILSRFLNVAVSAGKRVRSETGIAKGAVSISSAAVELAAMKAMEDLQRPVEECKVAIVGAGKMARLLVQHLVSRGVERLVIVNRTRPRAEELVKMFPDANIEIVLLDELLPTVASADVVFTSTNAETPILDQARLESARGHSTAGLMLIDISVPRNVSSCAGDAAGVASYNVDDLKAVVAKNQARRRRLVLDAEEVLRDEKAGFNNWLHSLGCVPAISKLQQRAESIRQDELERQRGKLAGLSDSERKAVEMLSKGIINKMLHSPMVHLRGLEDMEERTQTLRNIEALFKL